MVDFANEACGNQANKSSEPSLRGGGAMGGIGTIGDSWAHRSQGMRCRTCMWFAEKERPEGTYRADPRGTLGRCRRHAPTMNGFPAVFQVDWCGDHKLDEMKL